MHSNPGGNTLKHFFVAKLPPSSRYRALMASIKMEELTFPSECQIEPYLVNLLHRMLDKNPKTRITLEETMNHEWVTKEGVCPGGEIEVLVRDRRHSEAQRGIPHVAGSRGEDKQLGATVPRGGGGAASERTFAAAGAGGVKRKNSSIPNSTGGPSTDDHTGSTTSHDRHFSQPDETGSTGNIGDEKIASSPSTLPSASSVSNSRFYHCSSLSTMEAPVGEEHKQQQQQQQRRRRLQLKQEQAMQERGHHRRFSQEAAVVATRRNINTNLEEGEGKGEGEETSTWSDGDDKVPSPKLLEDIVDNW